MDDRNLSPGDNIIEIYAIRCACVNKKCLIEVCSCYSLGEKCNEYCPCEQDCSNKFHYDLPPNHEEIMEKFIGEGSRTTTQDNDSNNNNNNTRSSTSVAESSSNNTSSSEAVCGFSGGCRCTASRCILQACGCFRVREFCMRNCRCEGCINNVENKDEVEQARNERDTKGCSCRDVQCTASSKCWCSVGKTPCIKACGCKVCLNIYGRKPEKNVSEESKPCGR